MQSSSSSRMRVMNHNWSATKQRLQPQSVDEISRHSVLSGDRIRQCGTSSGSRHKDTVSLSCSDPGQINHTVDSVTKQYNWQWPMGEMFCG